MNKLKITNSLTGKKETFNPINKSKVSIYVCGPTVYENPHVGNARSLVVFDLLYRVLIELYGIKKVNYVRNITDVDDKIIESSKQKKISIDKITTEVTKKFHNDCKNLNCLKPNIEPKATEHIEEMIKMTESLIKKKYAYYNENHVYFSVSSFKNYGKLSNKNLEELKAGARVEVSKLKKNPLDFILWKPSDKTDPGWDSPWGRGRPGWHLECSVMSEKYLGKHFDIHGGGLDLVFPHHENEIAQSCSNNSSEKFANYWVHNGFVTMNKEKMSKSLGNIISIEDSVKKFSGQVVRLALLSSHYKQPLDWNDKLLQDQSVILNKWYSIFDDEHYDKLPDCFEHLLDDLNTPAFISKMHELFNLASKGNKDKKREFNKACRLIGLFNENLRVREALKKEKVKISEKFILMKIKERIEARKNGNFKLADKIRDELLLEGVIIEDDKEKTIWKYK
tara:strand:+ start:303 stop:1655 length:1353 start_codon:yes stop_codon:yes gene_type:complete